uniref:Uncharacterized protein n=1 Tax=Anopheles farauti TaxID=69004 RepID=A0A182QV17_9DIPT
MNAKVLPTSVLLLFVCAGLADSLPDKAATGPLPDVRDESELDGRAGPFDIRPTLPTVTSTEKATTSEQPLGGAAGLLGGAGLPQLGPGTQQSGSPQASLILGSFQAIITPFNPGMLGSVIGALGGGGGSGGGAGGGGVPSLPSFPIGSKPGK